MHLFARTSRRLAFVLVVSTALVLSPTTHAEEEDAAHQVDIMQTFVLDAPREEVWKAFTDERIAKKWFAPLIKIDLRTGGTFKASYDPARGLDGPGVITHHILALDAPSLAVMRTSVKEGHPFYGLIDKLVGTWRFEALPGDRTRLHLGTHGWPDTPRSRATQKYFQQANPQVLAQLKKLFPAPGSGAEAMKRLATLVGTYTSKLESARGTLLIHKAIEKGPGGKGFLATTSFGPEGARRVHKREQVWLDGEGVARFHALGDDGGSVTGRLYPEGESAVVWQFEDKGKTMRLYMTTGSAAGHVFRVEQRQEDASWKPLFSVDYAPES